MRYSLNMSMWTTATHDYLSFLAAAGTPGSTQRTRREHLNLVGNALGGSPWVEDSRPLLDWFAGLEVARETRRSRRTTLRAFYRWGVDSGRTAVDVAAVLPVVQASPPSPRPVPDRIYAEALAAADDRTRLMIRLAAEVGLRRAEVAQIHSRDLMEDLVGWTLVVHGKGGRDRLVPLSRGLAIELRAAGPGWLFPGDDGGHLSPRWVGTLVGQVLPQGWTMHKLRHRFASRAYAVDRDVFAVQELLGHASHATTRAYVLVPNDALRRTVEAVAA
ncbi:tyrosine-type recombinase/integrase [Mycolicibacterium sp.]|uniref:tyrosine-type recombinase/integrase n=1 Tax=Mycolicibacterium sp. TaxID=2320850 RepID=UPI00355CFA58